MSEQRCEVCGQRVRLNSSDEGTCSYDGIAEKELEQAHAQVAMLQESVALLVEESINGIISEVIAYRENTPEMRFKDATDLYKSASALNDQCRESLNVLASTPADCMKNIEARVLRDVANIFIHSSMIGPDKAYEAWVAEDLIKMAEEREK